MSRPRRARARREQTPAELATVARRFAAKAAERLQEIENERAGCSVRSTTVTRLDDLATELGIIAGALRQREGD